ncbi:MAG TPA: hypothetical protein VD867_17200 [Burkholderiales bacterium]|nr:hypothetical protein [Burkholderiales bacterium]
MAKDGEDTGTPEEARAARYDDELLCANWNPVIALLEWSCARTAADAARDTTPAVREEDVSGFLQRIYASGT